LYGYDDSCRILDSSGGRKRVVSWLLGRTYDPWGNVIEYTYKQEDGKGLVGPGQGLPLWEVNRPEASRCRQKYLKRIRYGNRSPNRDVGTWEVSSWPDDWMFEVLFDYGEHSQDSPSTAEVELWKPRQDPFSTGNIGFELRTYRLCRRVLMFHHFPGLDKGKEETLVKSTTFSYNESPRGSFLSGLVVSGHDTGEAEYTSESLPPWSFLYTTTPDPSEVGALAAEVANLVDIIPKAGASPSAEWIDLDGEGIPGLLTHLRDGTMLYQRNEGAGSSPNGGLQLGAPRLLDQQPSIGRYGMGEFRDLDKSGRLDLVCLDPYDRQPRGFYERDTSDTWSEYSDMTEISVTDPDLEKSALKIDVTGDGTDDLLCGNGEAREVIWRRSLGKKGMSGYCRTPSLASSQYSGNSLPRLAKTPSTTPLAQAFAADMTGDGIADVVEVSASKITYWPNHGHGHFGAAVEMGNPPTLGGGDGSDFTVERLRLVDADGSGTTDLIYLLSGGGAHLYYNQAGNSWSDPIYIPNIPKITSPSSVFTLDILGQGTACLCWADASNSSGLTQVRYLDLMGGVKPHLLCRYENGMGAAKDISYAASTKFRLDDQSRGRPWTRTLPFPVQCVSRVHATDYITAGSMTTDYAYHDGYYDPVDKHFAGFEMVEEWVRETIALADGETYESPETHTTKSWFSVGDGLSVDQSRFFAPPMVSSSVTQPAGEDPAQAHRALRGSRIRVETFGSDGTEKADRPYTVEDFSYDIVQLQPRSITAKYAVYQVSSRTTVHAQHERCADDPRVTHRIVLRANAWGDAEASLDVVYPRKTNHAVAAAAEFDDVKREQLAGSMLLTEISYTNAVSEGDCFRKPAVWQSLDYEIRNYPFSGVLDVDKIRRFDFGALPEEEDSSSRTWKALRSGQRSVFKGSDLSSRLAGGALQPYSIIDQSFELAFTPAILLEVKKGLQRNGVSTFLDDADIMKEGGFVNLDGDGNWWAPSDRAGFDSIPESNELEMARKTFYTPTVFTDAFGNRTLLELDEDSLLAGSTTDAVGQKVSFGNDYRHLQPVEIADSNFNIECVSLDPLGRTVAVAALGKGLDEDGDSLEGESAVKADDVVSALLKYSHDVGKQLLGNAGSRVFLCLNRFAQWKSQQAPYQPLTTGAATPACIVEISRDISYRMSDNPTIRVAITYLGGTGQIIQKVSLADPEDPAKSWVVQDLSASNMSGKTLRTFQPFFVSTPSFIPLTRLETSNATTNFYDSLGRSVGHLFPERTWTKTVITSWAVAEHDVGSTVLCADPRTDPDIGHYISRVKSSRVLPTWYQAAVQAGDESSQAAAAKSKVYQDSPTITHFGCRGLPIRCVFRVGTSTYTQALSYDSSGNKICETDSLGRLVQTKAYDLRGHSISSSRMDSGESWDLSDVNGKDLVSWNSRGIGSRHSYDALRREVERWTYRGGAKTLSVKTTYGEHCPEAADRNLKGKVWKVWDQSGVYENVTFDIRGHCTKRTFQPAVNYSGELDWQADTPLLDTVFTSEAFFDNFGQLLQGQDAQGNHTRRVFSPLGQVRQVSFCRAGNKEKELPLHSTTFTADGLPLLSNSGNGTSTQYSYDETSRRLMSRKTVLSDDTQTETLEDLSFAYDCCGRMVHVSDSSGQNNLLDDSAIKPEWDYSYDAVGQLVEARGRAQAPPSAGNHVQLQSHSARTQAERDSANWDRLYTYSESYTYDLVGNITHMKHDALDDSLVSGWTRSYHYEEPSLLSNDAAVKNTRLSKTLVQSTREQNHPTSSPNNVQDDETETGETEETYGYASDAGCLGCMTTLLPRSELTWNAQNLLASASTSNHHQTTYYVYDHSGRRVRKVTENVAATTTADVGDDVPRKKARETFYLDGVEFVCTEQQHPTSNRSERQGGTAFKLQLWTANIDGLAYIGTVQEHGGGGGGGEEERVRYRLGDSMELDESGRPVSIEEYSPFGALVARAGEERGGHHGGGGGHRFAQYRWDAETGLCYSDRGGARYYSPWLGRWVAPDRGGDADGGCLSPYQYALNDPVNLAASVGV
jgi:RHS repeat-associated protein